MTSLCLPVPSRRLALPGDEVHVWYAKPSDLRSDADSRARQLLAPDEMQRLDRFRFAHDRRTFLATRLLVRRVLSHYLERAPAEWKFVTNAHGRPRIDDEGGCGLAFNLSRTAGLVVCAVAGRDDIGIDVENILPEAPFEVADHFFAPAEVAALHALPQARRGERFYEYWTLKESYIKARGLGLAIPLHSFAFRLRTGDAPQIAIASELMDDAGSWRFAQLRPTVEHLVALCIRHHGAGCPGVAQRWQALAEP